MDKPSETKTLQGNKAMFLLAMKKLKNITFLPQTPKQCLCLSGGFFSLTNILLLQSESLLGGSTKNEKINVHWEPVRNNTLQKATVHLTSCTIRETTVKIVMISKRWQHWPFFVVSREVDMFRRKPTEARSTVCSCSVLVPAQGHVCIQEGRRMRSWRLQFSQSTWVTGFSATPECHQQNSGWCYREVKGKQGALSASIPQQPVGHGCFMDMSFSLQIRAQRMFPSTCQLAGARMKTLYKWIVLVKSLSREMQGRKHCCKEHFSPPSSV